MDEAKRRRLEAAGYRVGTADEFLALTAEDSTLLDMKLALRQAVRTRRESEGLTQAELAERLGSSQSRVAKLEGADPAVSLDLLMRALLVMGATRTEIARSLDADAGGLKEAKLASLSNAPRLTSSHFSTRRRRTAEGLTLRGPRNGGYT